MKSQEPREAQMRSSEPDGGPVVLALVFVFAVLALTAYGLVALAQWAAQS